MFLLCVYAARVEKKEASGGGKAKTSGGKTGKKKPTVNEEQIDLFLDMIKTADVTSEENQAENATLLELEGKAWHGTYTPVC